MIFEHTPESFGTDLNRFLGITKLRQSHFDEAPATLPDAECGANKLAGELHPEIQEFTFNGLTTVYNTVSACLTGETAACFRTGQSVDLLTGTEVIPCFIISSPSESKEGRYIIALTDRAACEYFRGMTEGKSVVRVSQPVGSFYYQPLRDGKSISIIFDDAGGFLAEAMEKDFMIHHSDVTVNMNEITGGSTVYAIGRQSFLDGQPEFSGGRKVRKCPVGLPYLNEKRREYSCRIINGNTGKTITVYSDITLEASFEKEGYGTTAKCTDGSCGFCRCRLIEGEVRTVNNNDCEGLRLADKKFGYIHPCRVFPCGDITVKF